MPRRLHRLSAGSASAHASASPADPSQVQRLEKALTYGGADVDDEMVSDSDSEEGTADHYRTKIVGGLNRSRKAILDRGMESSDSEDAAGSDDEAKKTRRKFKAVQLAALTRTFFPLEGSEMKFAEELHEKRKRDNEKLDKAGGKKRRLYPKETREDYERVGETMKLTSMEHNPYLRRSFREAIPADAIRQGGSQAYNQRQGSIRAHLQKVVAEDDKSMDWKREDFPDDRAWLAFNHLKTEGISNAPKDTYADRVQEGQDTKGSSTRTAFHHGAWKEAHPDFTPHALNPANLVAMNDERELLNPAKRKRAITEGTLPTPGAHDTFGHQAQGYRADESKEMVRARGGGQFKDADMEAIYYTSKPLLQPRAPKRDIYRSKPKKKLAAKK